MEKAHYLQIQLPWRLGRHRKIVIQTHLSCWQGYPVDEADTKSLNFKGLRQFRIHLHNRIASSLN